jgi:OHCU decarboxylase
MGSFSAILLNLAFNILGGQRNLVDEVTPTTARHDRLSIADVNGLPYEAFLDNFGPLFQGRPFVAEQVAHMRPFGSLYDMRHAIHEVLFDAPEERQRELIGSYPDLAAKVALGQESRRDQAWAGLDRLTPEEYEEFDRLNDAYREKFGHPFIMCVRENTKETILEAFARRLGNDPRQEHMAALVEIAKIANLRLLDLVEDRPPEPLPERQPALGEPPKAEA